MAVAPMTGRVVPSHGKAHKRVSLAAPQAAAPQALPRATRAAADRSGAMELAS